VRALVACQNILKFHSCSSIERAFGEPPWRGPAPGLARQNCPCPDTAPESESPRPPPITHGFRKSQNFKYFWLDSCGFALRISPSDVSCGEQVDDPLNGLIGFVIGGFDSAGRVGGVRPTDEQTVGQRTADPFVKEEYRKEALFIPVPRNDVVSIARPGERIALVGRRPRPLSQLPENGFESQRDTTEGGTGPRLCDPWGCILRMTEDAIDSLPGGAHSRHSCLGLLTMRLQGVLEALSLGPYIARQPG
jgi:hypothetical protein